MQDRVPPELPGSGEEGLSPLCLPTQVPRAECSHLTQYSVPTETVGWGSAQSSQLGLPSARLLPFPQDIMAVCLGKKTLGCDQSSSLPRKPRKPVKMCPSPLTTYLPWEVVGNPMPLSQVEEEGSFVLTSSPH